MNSPGHRITLAAFLARLDAETAGEVRAAAARIDDLERRVGPPGWLERNLVALATVAIALFAVGAGTLFGVFPWLRDAIGLSGVIALVGVFPALTFAYLFSVRDRTAIDKEKIALNDRHFLPHGGVYFSAPDSGGAGMVLRVKPPVKAAPTLRDRAEEQYKAATKRQF